MSLRNQNWITFGGKPVTGRTPARVRVSSDTPGLTMNAQQEGFVAHAYKLFCDAVNVSAFPDGYHVQNRRGPDGTEVRMESNAGVHRVFVKIRGAPVVFRCDVFPCGVFTSMDFPYGAEVIVPSGDVVADTEAGGGSSWSVWSNPPLRPPDGPVLFDLPKRSRWNPGDLSASAPGDMDWSDRRDGKPGRVVLSWWGGSRGRYVWDDEVTFFRASENYWEIEDEFPGIGEDFLPGATPEMARVVWANGLPLAVAPAGQLVVSACLAVNSDDINVLRVLTTDDTTSVLQVYELPFAMPKKKKSSEVMPLTNTPVLLPEQQLWSVESLGGIDVRFWGGVKFRAAACNGSGTRVLLAVVDPWYETAPGSRAGGCAEFDIESGDLIRWMVETDDYTVRTAVRQGDGSVTFYCRWIDEGRDMNNFVIPSAKNDSKNGNYEISKDETEQFLRQVVIAADYLGDEPVCLVWEEERTFTSSANATGTTYFRGYFQNRPLGGTLKGSGSYENYTSSSSYEFTASSTTTRTYRLMHTVHGQVYSASFTESYTASATQSTSASGQKNNYGTIAYSDSYTQDMSKHYTRGESTILAIPAVFGDLRADVFDFDIVSYVTPARSATFTKLTSGSHSGLVVSPNFPPPLFGTITAQYAEGALLTLRRDECIRYVRGELVQVGLWTTAQSTDWAAQSWSFSGTPSEYLTSGRSDPSWDNFDTNFGRGAITTTWYEFRSKYYDRVLLAGIFPGNYPRPDEARWSDPRALLAEHDFTKRLSYYNDTLGAFSRSGKPRYDQDHAPIVIYKSYATSPDNRVAVVCTIEPKPTYAPRLYPTVTEPDIPDSVFKNLFIALGTREVVDLGSAGFAPVPEGAEGAYAEDKSVLTGFIIPAAIELSDGRNRKIAAFGPPIPPESP